MDFIFTAAWKTSKPSRFIHQVSGGMGKLRSLAEKISNLVVAHHESPVLSLPLEGKVTRRSRDG